MILDDEENMIPETEEQNFEDDYYDDDPFKNFGEDMGLEQEI